MAAYKYHDVINNELYVMLLATSEIQPNQNNYWDQRRWNDQEMRITFLSSSSNVKLVNYLPLTTEGSISTTESINVGGETDGNSAKLSYSVSSSSTYTISEIPATALKSGTSKVVISHNFLKYKKNKDLNNPTTSHIQRNNLAIFKVENYVHDTIKSNFSVEYEGFIYRYGVYNQSTTSNKHTHTFIV